MKTSLFFAVALFASGSFAQLANVTRTKDNKVVISNGTISVNATGAFVAVNGQRLATTGDVANISGASSFVGTNDFASEVAARIGADRAFSNLVYGFMQTNYLPLNGSLMMNGPVEWPSTGISNRPINVGIGMYASDTIARQHGIGTNIYLLRFNYSGPPNPPKLIYDQAIEAYGGFYGDASHLTGYPLPTFGNFSNPATNALNMNGFAVTGMSSQTVSGSGSSFVSAYTIWPSDGLDYFVGRLSLSADSGTPVVMEPDFFGNLQLVKDAGTDHESTDQVMTRATIGSSFLSQSAWQNNGVKFAGFWPTSTTDRVVLAGLAFTRAGGTNKMAFCDGTNWWGVAGGGVP